MILEVLHQNGKLKKAKCYTCGGMFVNTYKPSLRTAPVGIILACTCKDHAGTILAYLPICNLVSNETVDISAKIIKMVSTNPED